MSVKIKSRKSLDLSHFLATNFRIKIGKNIVLLPTYLFYFLTQVVVFVLLVLSSFLLEIASKFRLFQSFFWLETNWVNIKLDDLLKPKIIKTFIHKQIRNVNDVIYNQ